jgi:hypothetical protein
MSALVRGYIARYAEARDRDTVDDRTLEAFDLERAVAYLQQTRQVSDLDRAILSTAGCGHSVNTGSRELGISRWLYSRKLRTTSRKMAGYLGWEYSDDRITSMVEARLGRGLEEDEAKKLAELYRIYAPSRTTGGILDV